MVKSSIAWPCEASTSAAASLMSRSRVVGESGTGLMERHVRRYQHKRRPARECQQAVAKRSMKEKIKREIIINRNLVAHTSLEYGCGRERRELMWSNSLQIL